MNAPCKGCDRRLVGCHGFCPEYRKWKDEWEKRKESQPQTPDLSWEMKRYLWRRMLGR